MNLSGLTPYDNSQFTILDLKVCFDFLRYDLYDREENRNRCLIIGSLCRFLSSNASMNLKKPIIRKVNEII